VIHSDTAFS